MSDLIKIGIKTALIGGVIVTLAVVLLLIQLPVVDFTPLSTYIGSVYAFAVHWCPIIERLWTTATFIIGVNIALLTFRAGLFLFKTIWAIFE